MPIVYVVQKPSDWTDGGWDDIVKNGEFSTLRAAEQRVAEYHSRPARIVSREVVETELWRQDLGPTA